MKNYYRVERQPFRKATEEEHELVLKQIMGMVEVNYEVLKVEPSEDEMIDNYLRHKALECIVSEIPLHELRLVKIIDLTAWSFTTEISLTEFTMVINKNNEVVDISGLDFIEPNFAVYNTYAEI